MTMANDKVNCDNQNGGEESNQCVVCNNGVEVSAQPISKDTDLEDDDDTGSYLISVKKSRRVRRLLQYLRLFCKLTNLNVDESFGHLFTSGATEGIILGPPCCSKCFTSLTDIWKIQKMIKYTQDLQQTNVNTLKGFLQANPSADLVNLLTSVTEPNCDDPIPERVSKRKRPNLCKDLVESPMCTDYKRSSVAGAIKRCDDLIPSNLKITRNASKPNPSPKRVNRQSKLKAVELVKKLAAVDSRDVTKVEKNADCEPTLATDDEEESFDPEDDPSDNENIESDQEEIDEGNKMNSNSILNRRRRSSNFSFEEVQVLLKLMKENSHILSGSNTIKFSQKLKADAFTKMRDAVNKVGGCDRSTQQIQAKIKNLRNTTNLEKLLNSPIPPSKRESGTGVLQTIVTKCKTEKKNAVQFSTKEVQVLLEMMNKYVTAVTSKNGTTGDVLKKMTIAVNRVGGMSRSVNQVRLKVLNMQTKMKKRRLKRTTLRSTGNDTDNSDSNITRLSLEPNDTIHTEYSQNSSHSALSTSESKPIIIGKRKRLDFSNEEVELLSKLIQENFKSLFKSDNHTKEKMLIKITKRVNQLGGNPRSKEQIREKIKNLGILSKKKKIDDSWAVTKLELGAKMDEIANRFKFFEESNLIITSAHSGSEDEMSEKEFSSVKRTKKPKMEKTGIQQTLQEESDDEEEQADQAPTTALQKPSQTNSSEVESYQQKPLVRVNGKYKCTKCDRIFNLATKLRAHQVTHLPKALCPLFNCSKCDDKFTSKWAVTIHMTRVHKEAPAYEPRPRGKFHMCHICNKKFFWFARTQFISHVQSHAGVNCPRPYVCEFCGKKFAQEDKLKRHAKKAHSPGRRHQCRFCVDKVKNAEKLITDDSDE